MAHWSGSGTHSALAVLVTASSLLTACGPSRTLKSVPHALVDEAHVEGLPHVRTWGDGVDEHYLESLAEAVRQRRAYFAAHPEIEPEATADILALSGGGEKGAFGAGLLCGWTEAGDRPQFRIVTGISTGALIAPLAFLGSEYDDVLRDAYTSISVDDVARPRGLLAAITRDGLADTEPLGELIQKWINDETLAAIAAEHNKGRRLLVGTVNLEAERPVIWDLGAIAASGHPDAPALFRQIMLASASIPGAFEPQYFKVVAGGESYEELHVDGGAVAQVFLWGAGVDLAAIRARVDEGPERPIRLFVLRNGSFGPDHDPVRPAFIDISGRAISSLIRTQGIGDTYRLYVRAQAEGMDFNLASIPEKFEPAPTKPFDPEYMSALFQFGYEQARGGYPWQKSPPYAE
ncbi:MAG: patatin-like phospholipase family protein [Phycisphaerales bacterium JB039]